MKQKGSIMRRLPVVTVALVSVLGLASGGLVSAATDDAPAQRPTRASNWPVGYWMGTDPLDGGDSRRGFRRNADGEISLAGRDSYVTLCGGTDRALFSFSDGVVAGPRMTSDKFVITCFNNGDAVTLRADYVLIDRGLMRETLTRIDGSPVTEIYFHKVSVPK
ncbi:hypothetical protein JS756_01200 [Streptomyces actuosus]|uniref:DUF306 domain-containing protein n=1 Tax=Streptomyces actuosus TaxID=1885 RepID=A0ABS2VI27_STRAS|nr:hypothetical protein [Streptomyces actuosus]MBN0042748.1 hypothetical protein [Streptomyces actuosus]